MLHTFGYELSYLDHLGELQHANIVITTTNLNAARGFEEFRQAALKRLFAEMQAQGMEVVSAARVECVAQGISTQARHPGTSGLAPRHLRVIKTPHGGHSESSCANDACVNVGQQGRRYPGCTKVTPEPLEKRQCLD